MIPLILAAWLLVTAHTIAPRTRPFIDPEIPELAHVVRTVAADFSVNLQDLSELSNILYTDLIAGAKVTYIDAVLQPIGEVHCYGVLIEVTWEDDHGHRYLYCKLFNPRREKP